MLIRFPMSVALFSLLLIGTAHAAEKQLPAPKALSPTLPSGYVDPENPERLQVVKPIKPIRPGVNPALVKPQGPTVVKPGYIDPENPENRPMLRGGNTPPATGETSAPR